MPGFPRRSWFWTIYTWTVVAVCLVTAATVALTAGSVAALLGDRRRRVAHGALAAGYRAIARLLPFEVEVTGIENLPEGPALLCPNHQSSSDIVYLHQLPCTFKWAVKSELFRLPLFGSSMRLAGYPAVRRGNTDAARQTLHRVVALLESGERVLVFPEGTRSKSGQLGSFHSGAARAAHATGAVLVPIGISGTDAVLPAGTAMYPARQPVRIHVGESIRPTGGVRNTTRTLRDAVARARGGR